MTKKRLEHLYELRLTSLFQQLLRELDLPLDYTHTNKALDFKRQQVGVRLREAFMQGRDLQTELHNEGGSRGAIPARFGGRSPAMPVNRWSALAISNPEVSAE